MEKGSFRDGVEGPLHEPATLLAAVKSHTLAPTSQHHLEKMGRIEKALEGRKTGPVEV